MTGRNERLLPDTRLACHPLELSGRQAGLIVAADLNGLVISLW
jgi:hypothetical protein